MMLRKWRYFRSFECFIELVNVKCFPDIHIGEFMMQQQRQTGSESMTVWEHIGGSCAMLPTHKRILEWKRLGLYSNAYFNLE
jgi:hypothetical protein